MNIVSYLKDIYGYSTPIFLKDIRIGRKSKEAIRKELSRAVENGEIERKKNGIYYFKEEFDSLTFDKIVEKKFIKDDYDLPGLDLDIYGYYSGETFLNMIGISQQVPAILQIVTNNTSCKREYQIGNRKAIIKKGRIRIDRFNYKALQFFEMIEHLSIDEIKENKKLLEDYITNNLYKSHFEKYIEFYSVKTLKKLVEGGLLYAFR